MYLNTRSSLLGAAVLLAGRLQAAVVRLDFGTSDSPVREGFLAVTDKSALKDGRQAGWLDTTELAALDRPIPRTPFPPVIYTTDIRQDSVQSRAAATLRVAVPAGKYRVWLMAGTGGGGTAQVWDVQVRSGPSCAKATFFGENTCRVMTMDAVSGKAEHLALNITTRSKWAINATVIASLDEWPRLQQTEIAKLEQEAFLLPDDALKKWRHTPHEDTTPPPEYTEAERGRGFVVYHRPWPTPIWPNTMPRREDFDPTLKAFAAPNECEPFTFTVMPLRDFARLAVAVTDLETNDGRSIPAEDIEIRYVQYKFVRPNYKLFGTYYRAPDLLPRFDRARPLTAGENFRVWLTVHVRPYTPAGMYRGAAVLELDGRRAAEVPMVLRVLPITLQKDRSVLYGTYYRHPSRYVHKAPDTFSRRWWVRKAECDFASMAAHGYNSSIVSMTANIDRAGRWTVSGDGLDRELDMARRHGFDPSKPIVCYFSYSLQKRYRHHTRRGIVKHMYGVKMAPQAFFDDVTAMVHAFERERKRRGWPELIYYPFDEPATTKAAMALMVRILQAVKKAPGVRTYVTADPSNPAFSAMKPYVDVWCSHLFSMTPEQLRVDQAQRGVEHWCYPNCVSGENDHTPVAGARMTYGSGLWRTGYRALFPWIYQSWAGDPANNLDAAMMEFFNHTADDASVTPCTLYEAYREGIDDGRYITTLRRWIEQARGLGRQEAADAAQKDLDFVWSSIAEQTSYKYDTGWADDSFDVYRWIIASRILALQDVCIDR